MNVSTDYLLGRTEKKEQIIVDEDFNPLKEIEEMTKKLGLEGLFFHDIDAWKNFTPEDVEELRKHFEWVAHKAKEEKEIKTIRGNDNVYLDNGWLFSLNTLSNCYFHNYY